MARGEGAGEPGSPASCLSQGQAGPDTPLEAYFHRLHPLPQQNHPGEKHFPVLGRERPLSCLNEGKGGSYTMTGHFKLSGFLADVNAGSSNMTLFNTFIFRLWVFYFTLCHFISFCFKPYRVQTNPNMPGVKAP